MGGGLTVLRDPSGFLPAYGIEGDGLQLVASDVDDLFPPEAPPPRINWDFVAHFLTFPDLRGAATGLLDVQDLIPGVSYVLGDHPSATVLWNPWTFTRPTERVINARSACEQVRATVLQCTANAWSRRTLPFSWSSLAGWTRPSSPPRSPRVKSPASAVTLVTADAAGDERRYACLAAARTGLSLQERPISAEGIRLDAPPLGRRVRPGSFSLLQTSEAAFADALRAVNAAAFVSGTGGDRRVLRARDSGAGHRRPNRHGTRADHLGVAQ